MSSELGPAQLGALQLGADSDGSAFFAHAVDAGVQGPFRLGTAPLGFVYLADAIQAVAINALLLATSTRAGSVDSYLHNLRTKTLSIDARLWDPGDHELQQTLDALLVIAATKTGTVSAVLSALGLTKAGSIDSRLVNVGQLIQSIDAVLSGEGLVRSGSVDAFLYGQVLLASSVDSLLSAQMLRAATVDSLLRLAGLQAGSVDAVLSAVGVTKAGSVDAVLRRVVAKTHGVSALLYRIPVPGAGGLRVADWARPAFSHQS